MEVAFDSRLRAGSVAHPPIAYSQCGIWTRSAGEEPRQLFQTWKTYSCPLAWSPDGEWVCYSNGNELLAFRFETAEKAVLWKGSERVHWLLQCCATTGRLLFRAGERLILCEPVGLEHTLFRGDFFTVDAAMSASRAVLLKDEELILVDWSEELIERALLSGPPSEFARLITFFAPDFALLAPGPKVAAPCFSPDGRQVAFLKGDYELWTVGQDGSEPIRWAWVTGDFMTVAERRGSYAFRPAWSSDGRFLIAQLTLATDHPTRANARIEQASVILDFKEFIVEVWPGYHDQAIFRPSVINTDDRWCSVGSRLE